MDLNADLGEGGADDPGLLDVVTSASVACGFHAGDPSVMARTARCAAARGVTLGAHPSYADRDGFGRRAIHMDPEDLFILLVYQIGAMAAIAVAAGTTLRFVKPHGALYNQAAVEPQVADAVVAAVQAASWPRSGSGLALLCPAGSQMAKKAEASGLVWYSEAFADRHYNPDGTLVSRDRPGAVIESAGEVVAQAVHLARHQRVRAHDGTEIEMPADSICLHGDTPGAIMLATAVRRGLEDAGIEIAPFLAG